jgi:hypothetical protein
MGYVAGLEERIEEVNEELQTLVSSATALGGQMSPQNLAGSPRRAAAASLAAGVAASQVPATDLDATEEAVCQLNGTLEQAAGMLEQLDCSNSTVPIAEQQASLKMHLRQRLEMLRLDNDREVSLAHARCEDREASVQRWAEAALASYGALTQANKEVSGTEIRLQELIDGRVQRLQAAQDRTKLQRIRVLAKEHDLLLQAKDLQRQERAKGAPNWMRQASAQVDDAVSSLFHRRPSGIRGGA